MRLSQTDTFVEVATAFLMICVVFLYTTGPFLRFVTHDRTASEWCKNHPSHGYEIVASCVLAACAGFICFFAGVHVPKSISLIMLGAFFFWPDGRDQNSSSASGEKMKLLNHAPRAEPGQARKTLTGTETEGAGE